MRFPSRAALLTAALALAPAVASSARAQDAPAATGPAQAPPAAAPTDSAAPSGSAAPVIPATGYGWSTTPHRHGPHRPRRPGRAAANAQKPDAILPGFETLADGSTRLFVQLTKPVTYATKASPGVLTYVLKGAYADKWNNTNPLVTVHFNTPVTTARLVPHGQDLWFVVDLRSNVTPQVTMDATKEGGAMLRIDFPKGDYLPMQGNAPTAPAPPSSPPPAPAAPPPPAPPASR
ncbi:MAG TPA: hypothetical protein VGG39_16035 [Polyangiaceae bacterium]|jgi:hypothetical protein